MSYNAWNYINYIELSTPKPWIPPMTVNKYEHRFTIGAVLVAKLFIIICIRCYCSKRLKQNDDEGTKFNQIVLYKHKKIIKNNGLWTKY